MNEILLNEAQKLLNKAFAKEAQACFRYEQLPPSHQKEYLRWIAEAKKLATRERRVEKTIAMLLDKQA